MSMLSSLDSVVNQRISELEAKIEKHIAGQQQFLEWVDRNEQEANVAILGDSDQDEALDDAKTDHDKPWMSSGDRLVWMMLSECTVGKDTIQKNVGTRNPRPILLTLVGKV